MKAIRLYILLMFLGSASFAQVKPGIYKAIGDSILTKTGRINDESQLSLNIDHTFSYQHRTAEGTAFWFDRKGTWSTRAGKLFLAIPDSACTAVFKIQGNVLKYLFNMCDPEKQGWRTKQTISGNFMYKQE